jgi:hypothetical protein
MKFFLNPLQLFLNLNLINEHMLVHLSSLDLKSGGKRMAVLG